jgi:hypothetical protein
VSGIRCRDFSLTPALSQWEREISGKKREPLEGDSLTSKSRNNHSEKMWREGSLALGMPIHWAEFYADSQGCQEGAELIDPVHDNL